VNNPLENTEFSVDVELIEVILMLLCIIAYMFIQNCFQWVKNVIFRVISYFTFDTKTRALYT
jgi:spore maturation protein SpmB